ncbi:MAG: hypothetical protein LBJ37_00060 [Paucimonas sp.]|jgi:hypothetical protein|nr:hypothetical protein [Paucimonas sp.]
MLNFTFYVYSVDGSRDKTLITVAADNEAQAREKAKAEFNYPVRLEVPPLNLSNEVFKTTVPELADHFNDPQFQQKFKWK